MHLVPETSFYTEIRKEALRKVRQSERNKIAKAGAHTTVSGCRSITTNSGCSLSWFAETNGLLLFLCKIKKKRGGGAFQEKDDLLLVGLP